jgi:hypothetical protein
MRGLARHRGRESAELRAAHRRRRMGRRLRRQAKTARLGRSRPWPRHCRLPPARSSPGQGRTERRRLRLDQRRHQLPPAPGASDRAPPPFLHAMRHTASSRRSLLLQLRQAELEVGVAALRQDEGAFSGQFGPGLIAVCSVGRSSRRSLSQRDKSHRAVRAFWERL